MCSILLVEDHADTRQAFAGLLRNWGHEVSACDSSAHGLEFLDTAEVDVILSDIGLPDQDGFAFIAKVRQTNSDVTAIAISAYFTASDQRRGRAAGFDMYFPKPVDLLTLRRVLVRMNSRSGRNRPEVIEDEPLRQSFG
jgi:CheY-like chemotaxis protein